MPRENSKCRQWEKERRNRLNEAFKDILKVLPDYDPAVNVSKIDILQNACKYITELQEKIKDLMGEKKKETEENEMIRLQKRINKLLQKNEMLCNLLRTAKITIPFGCSFRKQDPKRPWSKKITPEQAELIRKKELDKENNPKQTKKKSKTKTPEHRKAILNRVQKKKRGKTKKTPNQSAPIVLTPTVPPPYYIITNINNTPITTSNTNQTTTTTSSTNQILATTKTKTNDIASLGCGTLILANGAMLTILPNNTQPKIKSTVPTTSLDNIYPPIKPKICNTKTTQINKVPIPALTSNYKSKKIQKIDKEIKKEKSTEKSEMKSVEKVKEPERKVEENLDKTAEIAKTDVEKKIEEKSQEETAENIKILSDIQIKPQEEKVEKKLEVDDVEMKIKEKTDDLNLNHSELSNDIFASLQMPAGCQNPESTSPTAAFLLAFPLVSSLTGVKVTEVTEEDTNANESQQETPNLLQIGTMETAKTTQSVSESLLNLDNVSTFFSTNNYYNTIDTNPNKLQEKTIDDYATKNTSTNKLYTNGNNYMYTYDTNYYKSKHDNRNYGLNYDEYPTTDYCCKQNTSKPVNWMTTPNNLGTFNKSTGNDFYYENDVKKSIDLVGGGYQKNDLIDENQYGWSTAGKVPQYLDLPHNLVPSTLPTLVGDLALNFDQKTMNKRKIDDNTNFLSVSQLVETDKNKRNRPIRHAQKLSNKRNYTKKCNYQQDYYNNNNNHNKNKSSNYSAEALISDNTTNTKNFTTNKPLSVSSFLSENILTPYFTNEENFNQNYNQTTTFAPHNAFIPSSTTNTSNFYHDIHDYSDNLFPKQKTYTNSCQMTNQSVKKTKKATNENLPNYTDFSLFPIGGTINSPMVNDDFSSYTNFLPPPTTKLYPPCKNTLYKQNGDLGGLLTLPPVPNTKNLECNTSNTLANFNLSTIFPEMNKMSDEHLNNSNKMKNQQQNNSYRDKPSFNFSYINTQT